MLCREGLQSTLVYLEGASRGEGKSGVKVGVVNTKVVLQANITLQTQQQLPECQLPGRRSFAHKN